MTTRVRWLLAAMFALTWGCNNAASSGSTGETSSSTGAGVQACNQTCQDDAVAYGIDNTWWLLNNENLDGKPAGTESVTASCPLGGTVQITGTTTVATNDVETLTLTLDMQDCGSSAQTYELTFSGTVQVHGTFPVNGSSGSNAVSFSASPLQIDGTVLENGSTTIAESCVVNLTDTYDHVMGETGWLNGEICERVAGE